jgi:hypothetical protein
MKISFKIEKNLKQQKNKVGIIKIDSYNFKMVWVTLFETKLMLVIIGKPMFNLYRLKSNFKNYKKSLEHWFKYNVMRSKVYFEASTTDCDCVRSDWSGVCDNITEYNKMVYDIYDNAEGSTYVNIIDKKDYVEYSNTKDYIMDAFENGRGSQVII